MNCSAVVLKLLPSDHLDLWFSSADHLQVADGVEGGGYHDTPRPWVVEEGN